jgi:predicted nucleic acid-binding protein
MDRVFLDANVLFSAAYAPDSRLPELWLLEEAEIVTSLLALEEAKRNLSVHSPSGVARLDGLASNLTKVAGTRTGELPEGVELADKDIPILLAAIDSGCNHLLTGDKQHFGALYGRRVGGTLVQRPGQYLKARAG